LPSHPLDRLYDDAVQEYRRGNFTEAVRKLEEADKVAPDTVRVQVLLGWSYWRMGQSRRAEEYFAHAYQLDNSVEDTSWDGAFQPCERQGQRRASLFQWLSGQHPDDKELQWVWQNPFPRPGQPVRGQHYARLLSKDPTTLPRAANCVSFSAFPKSAATSRGHR